MEGHTIFMVLTISYCQSSHPRVVYRFHVLSLKTIAVPGCLFILWKLETEKLTLKNCVGMQRADNRLTPLDTETYAAAVIKRV